MIIAVSGTPGTGKSRVAELAAGRLGYSVMEINRLLKIPYEKEAEVSIGEINRKVSANLHDDTIIVSHLSHFLKDRRIKLFFVLRCEPFVLARRLGKRGYGKKKIYDNVMFEALDGTYLEASSLHKNVIQIDNTSGINRTVQAVVSFVKNGEKPPGFKKDYSKYVLKIEKRFGA